MGEMADFELGSILESDEAWEEDYSIHMKKRRDLVNLESPYAGNVDLHIMYAQFCMHDCLVNYNEAPFASHLLYTQPNVLDDDIPEERSHGIEAGRDFAYMTDKTVVYTDLGVSSGMKWALDHADEIKHPVIERQLPQELWDAFHAEAVALGYLEEEEDES